MIFKLLALEYKKFKKNSVITMLLGMYLIFHPIAIFFIQDLELPIPGFTKESIYGFPGIWEYMAYEGSWLVFFFLGFIAVHIVTSEVSNKTLRQNIITGLSRRDFFIGKLAVVTSLAIFASIYYFICSFAIGWLSTSEPNMELALQTDFAVPKFFLMSFAYMIFGLFVGFVIRKAGLAVLAYLSYVMFLEPLIKLLHIQLYQGTVSKIVNYWPTNMMEDLTPNPFYKIAENIPSGIDYPFLLSTQEAVIGSCIYTVLFITLAWLHFKKNDI
jgi:ABC-type transport system involved in multi-copper enzyme maturation permease subunit